MTVSDGERTTPNPPEPGDEEMEGPGLWGDGLTPHSLYVLAEFAEWFARTQAPNLADFVEKALVRVLSGAELTYSLDSGGLCVDLPGLLEFETVVIELPDKATEMLENVNTDPLWMTPSAGELEGLARTRAMLTRWLELVDARLALPPDEGPGGGPC